MELYNYNRQTWRASLTGNDGSSFFHSVFGEREQEDRPYIDKDIKFHRKCWTNVLTYFNCQARPTRLTELLEAYIRRKYKKNYYYEYVADISRPDYEVLFEDIPIISTLENVRIIILTYKLKEPIIIEPDSELLGCYPLKSKNDLREAVICHNGHKFSRVNPEKGVLEPKNIPEKKKYNKLSGNAGIKGSLYQIDLLTIFLLNGLNKCACWRLSTENAIADKFDDLVFELVPSEIAILLQAKHRKNKSKRITYDELFTNNSQKDDFSLPKYFFSYRKIKDNFKIRNVIVCTNVDVSDKAKDIVNKEVLGKENMLYYEGTSSICYTFNENSLPDLKKGISEFSKNVKTGGDAFSDEDIKDFLKHFQFIANFPSQGDLDQVIDMIVSQMEFCSRFESKDYSKYITNKMIEWFEEDKGRYLTEINAKAFFSEIRSNKFCEKLHNCNVFAKDNALPNAKKILHVISLKRYVLNMIKVYVALHGESEMLFVNPRGTIEVQKQIIEAFEVPHYTVLVVCLLTASDDVIKNICDKIMQTLNKFDYKKLILISTHDDKLAKRIKEANADAYEEISENITFNDLTEESQERVLQKVLQFFNAKV
ncbi:hypothetical protein NQ314_020344 [Rhamnusium bicolor]|uniref:Uncharacterized protein n=1 Tax=Rhamnusium bicolor TaxID=1586634 RepID=A0AAV8WM80_9CUCU|nr:hypothetical protein NQ314_020344 [Rhamnusium bicolor]